MMWKTACSNKRIWPYFVSVKSGLCENSYFFLEDQTKSLEYLYRIGERNDETKEKYKNKSDQTIRRQVNDPRFEWLHRKTCE